MDYCFSSVSQVHLQRKARSAIVVCVREFGGFGCITHSAVDYLRIGSDLGGGEKAVITDINSGPDIVELPPSGPINSRDSPESLKSIRVGKGEWGGCIGACQEARPCATRNAIDGLGAAAHCRNRIWTTEVGARPNRRQFGPCIRSVSSVETRKDVKGKLLNASRRITQDNRCQVNIVCEPLQKNMEHRRAHSSRLSMTDTAFSHGEHCTRRTCLPSARTPVPRSSSSQWELRHSGLRPSHCREQAGTAKQLMKASVSISPVPCTTLLSNPVYQSQLGRRRAENHRSRQRR